MGYGMRARAQWLLAPLLMLFLTACQIEAIVPLSVAQIEKAAKTGEPVDVTARLFLTFASQDWCRDMGASLIAGLSGPNLKIEPIGCNKDPQGNETWLGELRMRTSLIAGKGDDDLLAGAFARLAVVPDSEQSTSRSLAILLDAQRLENARAQLLTLPVAQVTDDASKMDLAISLILKNDLAAAVTLSTDANTTEPVSELDIPAGGVRTITLSEAGVAALMKDQRVNLFAVNASE